MYKVIKESFDDRWFFVIGICDICGYEHVFFIPAEAYDEEITGCECAQCGNMGVYPQEKNNEK